VEALPGHRPIRSFVLREGRMTPGQKKAWETLWPVYGIEPDGKTLDPPTLFGNTNPVYLEIGFGNGDALLERADRDPARNQLGIEVHRPGIGHLLNLADQRSLHNIRLIRDDAVEVLRNALPDASLAGVYLFFPDPWHKKKHHKRRIVNPAFVDQIARVLRPGGFLHIATDWEDYARHVLAVMGDREDFVNRASHDLFIPRPDDRPLTRFEQRGQRLGHGTWDMLFSI